MTGPEPDKAIRFLKNLVAFLLVLAGLISAFVGVGIAGTETYHMFHGNHGFEPKPFIYAAGFLIGGPLMMAMVIQTGSVKESLGVLAETLPLLRAVRPGGRRKTDPDIKVDIPEEKKP